MPITLPGRVTRGPKAPRTRTEPQELPVAVKSRTKLPASTVALIHAKLEQHVAHAAALITRSSVRFEDVNGPRGGNDVRCRVELHLTGRPPLLVEQGGSSPEAAFARALPRVVQQLSRIRGKHGLSTRRARPTEDVPERPAAPPGEADELIGKRAGRGPKALARALERPEKLRRDAYVDTSLPGVSASDRKAGGGHSARRNSKASFSKATVMLEDSAGRPSRKSTRRSANHSKASQGKERTAVARSVTPAARARRGR